MLKSSSRKRRFHRAGRATFPPPKPSTRLLQLQRNVGAVDFLLCFHVSRFLEDVDDDDSDVDEGWLVAKNKRLGRASESQGGKSLTPTETSRPTNDFAKPKPELDELDFKFDQESDSEEDLPDDNDYNSGSDDENANIPDDELSHVVIIAKVVFSSLEHFYRQILSHKRGAV